MPKLPGYQDVGNVSPTIKRDPGVNAPIGAFQSGAGIAAQELAPGINFVAEVVRKEEHRKDQAQVNDSRRQLLELETEQNEWLSQQKGENAFTAKAQLDKNVEARLGKIRDGLKNDRQRNAFAEVEADWKVGLKRTSSRTIASEMDKHYDSVDKSLLEASSRAAQKSAGLGDFDRVQQEWTDQEKVIAGFADRKGLVGVERQTELDKRKSNFHSGIALQLIADGNDNSAQKYHDENSKEFDADDSIKIQNMLKARRAEDTSAMQARLKDLSAMALQGVSIPSSSIPSRSEVLSTFGAEKGERIYRDSVAPMVSLNQKIAGIRTMPVSDQMKLLEGSKPAPGDGFAAGTERYQALAQAISHVQRQAAEDPASYVIEHSPTVKQAWDNMQEASGDPVATDRYVIASRAEQERLQIDQNRKRLGLEPAAFIPKNVADKIVSQFYDQKNGGENSAQLVKQLSNQWGKHWPEVYGQIAKSLPGSAIVIGAGMTGPSADLLARASTMKKADLEEGLEPDKTKTLKDTLPQTMAGFQRTLAEQPGGVGTFNTFYEQTHKLALMYIRSGKEPKEAAQMAFNETVANRYEFTDTYRIPKTADADLVQRGARNSVENISIDELKLPDSQIGLDEKQISIAYKDAIKKNAYWLTSSDESGLTLYSNGSAILDKTGEPVRKTWQQLIDKAGPSTWERVKSRASGPRGG